VLNGVWFNSGAINKKVKNRSYILKLKPNEKTIINVETVDTYIVAGAFDDLNNVDYRNLKSSIEETMIDPSGNFSIMVSTDDKYLTLGDLKCPIKQDENKKLTWVTLKCE
jgi:hypothetical protein